MSNEKPNLLFYMEENSLCMSIIQILKCENMLGAIKLVDIKKLKIIPQQIKEVPTLILPQINKILVGKDILIFLKDIIDRKKQQQHQQQQQLREGIQVERVQQQSHTPPPQQTPQPQQSRTPPPERKVLGYVSEEMEGYSDKYAYKDINECPQHNYVNCNEMKQEIYTGQETKRISEEDMEKIEKEAKLKREREEREINNIFTMQRSNIKLIMEKQNELNKKIEDQVKKREEEYFMK